MHNFNFDKLDTWHAPTSKLGDLLCCLIVLRYLIALLYINLHDILLNVTTIMASNKACTILVAACLALLLTPTSPTPLGHTLPSPPRSDDLTTVPLSDWLLHLLHTTDYMWQAAAVTMETMAGLGADVTEVADVLQQASNGTDDSSGCRLCKVGRPACQHRLYYSFSSYFFREGRGGDIR